MKTNQRQSRIGGAVLVLSLLFGIGIALSTTAQAQYPNDRNAQDRGRDWDRYGNYGGSFELRQTALNAGYNEGVRAGNNDRQNNRHTDYRDFDVYQRATKDYNSRLGDRELYRRYFREAFENGYNADGYAQNSRGRDDRDRNWDRNDNRDRNRRGRNSDGYGNYGGSFQLRQTALNAGFNEGFKQGRKDRNKRNRFGFQSQSAYQKATKDYSSRLGDREIYRRYFREAYEHGFADGLVSN